MTRTDLCVQPHDTEWPAATREVAERTLDRLALLADGRRPVRAYQCPRGWWHLTSRPTWPPTRDEENP